MQFVDYIKNLQYKMFHTSAFFVNEIQEMSILSRLLHFSQKRRSSIIEAFQMQIARDSKFRRTFLFARFFHFYKKKDT